MHLKLPGLGEQFRRPRHHRRVRRVRLRVNEGRAAQAVDGARVHGESVQDRAHHKQEGHRARPVRESGQVRRATPLEGLLHEARVQQHPLVRSV